VPKRGRLRSIPEPRNIIRQLPFQRLLVIRQLLRPNFRRNLISPRILPRAPCRHEQRKTKSHTTQHISPYPSHQRALVNLPNEPNQDPMASFEPRPIPTQIHITRYYPPTIASHHLHRNTRASLQTTSNVPAVPRHP
jgi:hypothetical protein